MEQLMPIYKFPQLVDRGAIDRRRIGYDTVEELGTPPDDLDQQFALALHVRIERRAEHAELFAQVSHRGSVEATLGKQTTCGSDHIATRPSHSRPADSRRAYIRRTQLISLRTNERSFVWWRGA